jgi:hypothetical protein
MKLKLMIMVALGAMSFYAKAQTEKGKKFINGSIGYATSKSQSIEISNMQNSKTKSYFILPSFGYFFGKNLAVGAGIGYSKNKSEAASFNFNSGNIYNFTQINEQSSINISPFVRYYIDVAEKFKFFGHLNTAIGFGKSISLFSGANIPDSSEGKHKSYNASLSPGFAFFPSKRWAIEFSLPLVNYYKFVPEGDSNSTTESFTIATSSFNPAIGFNFHF